MEIVISNSEFCFAFFYTLSFLTTYILFITFSIRLKIPLWSLLLMLTTVSLFTIVGSRLSVIPVSDWGQIISSGMYDAYPGRYAVGGLLFGLAGLLISLNILSLGKPVIDLYAWIAPLGFGIQKIGCFLNGCCYGKPTELPWSIKYSMGTNAHFHQWVNGIIENTTDFTVGVHPVQLYEVIALFIIAIVVWRAQKFLTKTGSTLLLSIGLFFLLRFFIEFLRDPATSNFKLIQIAGISLVQYSYLIAGVLCTTILLLYEKRLKPIFREHSKNDLPVKISLAYVLLISVLIFVFRAVFTPFELISLDMKFIPAILLTAYFAFIAIRELRFRVAATTFFVLPIFFIIQTSTPDTNNYVTIRDFYLNQVKSYKRLDVGTSIGNYSSTLRYNPQAGSCGTTYTKEDYDYTYRILGVGYSSIKKKDISISTVGINMYGGINKEHNLTKQWEKTNFLIGVNPYFKYDRNWLGFGTGLNLGYLRWVPGSPIDETSYDMGTRVFPLLPEAYFRVGRQDIVSLKYNYGFNNPTALPLPFHEISLGSGFGFRNELDFRIGFAATDNNENAFIYSEGLLNKQMGFTFKLNFGNGAFSSVSENSAKEGLGRIQFGLNYRFGFEK